LLDLQRQPVHAFAHVGPSNGQPHPHPARKRDHRRASTSRTRSSAAASTSRSTRTRRPPFSSISISPAVLRHRRRGASLIAAAAPRPGEHAVHIGAGVGYYTAILAELVGAAGRVTTIEFDAELAARATANLARTPHVRALHGDATRIMFEPTDVIYFNAGATRSADAWLERLKHGGRLILPLTTDGFPNGDVRRGMVFRIERCGPEF